MAIALKPGTRLLSAVCATEMIAVRAPGGEVDVTIGGGTAMGKRYVDADDTIELLCTKPGDGVPALDGTPLVLKDAKPLPASD